MFTKWKILRSHTKAPAERRSARLGNLKSIVNNNMMMIEIPDQNHKSVYAFCVLAFASKSLYYHRQEKNNKLD